MACRGTPLLAHDAGTKSWKEPLCPWTSVACIVYSIVAVVASIAAIAAFGITPRWRDPSPDEVWHAKVAILLVFSAFLTEVCFMASSATNAVYLGINLSESLQLHRLGDSVLTISEYIAKVGGGAYMGFCGGGVVHTDTLAWGGPRPVYLARFWMWSIAVPILVVISNRAFMNKCSASEMILRNLPSVVASFLYCWVAWVMEVSPDLTIRYVFMALCLIGFVLVSIDQLCIAYTHRHDDLFGWKVTMLAYQLLSYVLYSVLFLLGRFGMVTSFTEQVTYAYCDSSIKVFQGAILAMLRNRQDLSVMRSWWVAALSVGKDLDNLIQKARVPVLAMDIDGHIIEWNSNLVKLTGLRLEDVIGKALVDVASVECRESIESCISHVVGTATEPEEDLSSTEAVTARPTCVRNFVELMITVSGGTRAISGPVSRQLAMTMVPKSTSDGRVAGIVAIGQDLSDIAELKIIQERKSALMAMLSHEIRSPLHGIMGLTGAMLESELGKSMGRQLGMVKGCTARLLDMVTNIMDLAQHEKRKRDGRPAPRPSAPVDFAAIANEVATLTEVSVDKSNKPLIRPSVKLVNAMAGKQVPLVAGDPQKCTQLIYNLVTNACKFTEHGSVTIAARHETQRNVLEVEVVDTGRGISKEGQLRIFQAFEQEQNGDTRSFQGIGLGLAVCTEIMELHGGALRVSSELGCGSTFTASFPCDGGLGLGEVFDARAPAPPAQRQEPPRASAALLLSVDSDMPGQAVVKAALHGLCAVHCAANGDEAAQFLAERRAAGLPLPDVVMLDARLCLEVCGDMRQHFEGKLPVVVTTATVSAGEAAPTDAADFIPKPYDREVLRRKLQLVLRGSGAGASTMLLATEASMRLKEASQKLWDLQSRAALAEERSKDGARAAEDLEAKVRALTDQLQSSKKASSELRRKLAEAEDQQGSILTGKSREAKQEVTFEAEAQIAKAEKKAQEWCHVVRQLRQTSHDDDDIWQTGTGRRSRSFAEAVRASAVSTAIALAAESTDRSTRRAMEEQRRIIGTLLQEAKSARGAILALSSRIEILHTLAQGSFELLPAPLLGKSTACASWYNGERRILASHLQLMETVADSRLGFASLPVGRHASGLALCDLDIAKVDREEGTATFIGA